MRVSAWFIVAVVCAPAIAPAPFGQAQGSPAPSTSSGSSRAESRDERSRGAQAPAPQTPVFRTGIDLLTVDVTVTDADGRQVADLGPADFTIEVDGDARQVVSAEYLRLTEDIPASRPAQRMERAAATRDDTFFSTNGGTRAAGRAILLLVDQGNIRSGMARGVMRSAVRFVDGLQPSDRVAVVAIPGPGVLVDFTTDHEKAREGMLTITGTQQPSRNRFNISLSEALATVEHSDALLRAQLMARECVAGLPSELERCEREVEQEASEIVTQQRLQTEGSLRGMRNVLSSLGALEGPKSVLLISEGLMLDGLTGDVDQIAAIAADVRASLDVLLLDVPPFDAATRDRPTTPREDRDLQVQGLESLAGLARGGLHRVSGTADRAFQRIMRSLAGYYLIGVEATQADRDGRRHRIRVRTTRKDLQVRSRRGFLAPAGPVATSPAEAVARALRSPLSLTEIPLRMATWTYQDRAAERVRVLVAVEIERLADQPLEYTTGLVLVDSSSKAIMNSVEPRTLARVPGDEAVAVFAGAVAVDPGRYLVRFAAADSSGRIASVERRIDAWEMNENELTMGDLLVAPPPENGSSLQPSVEARVQGQLVALLEVYARDPALLDGLDGTLDVLTEENGAPLASTEMLSGSGEDAGTLRAIVDTSALPPGRYLARATVHQGGAVRGHLLRPLRVIAATGANTAPATAGRAAPAELVAALTADLAPLAPRELLAPAVMSSILAAAEQGRTPATTAAFQEARGGRLGPAALAALDGGDQSLAAFLRGLDFFGKNQPDRAAQQFQSAMQDAPSFAPARLYLGASLAQGTRYREAASLLQSVPLDLVPDGTPARLAGETWLKAGEATLAAEALERASADKTDDDWRTSRLLGIAYAVSHRSDEALAVLTPHLDAHAADHAALLAGIYSAYRRHLAPEASSTLAADRDLAVRWATVYESAGGPLQPLVASWIAFLQKK